MLLGWYGNDLMFGGRDDDFLSGDQDDDILDGGDGSDLLAGGPDSDQLFGSGGNDVLYGDWFIDHNLHIDNIDVSSWSIETTFDDKGRISAWTEKGFHMGEATNSGDDLLAGGAGNDYLDGGRGNDTLFGDTGHDRLLGMDGSDTLYGGDGFDILDGEEGNDDLFGGEGDDSLRGGAGDDELSGGIDGDFLFGEAGTDTLNGEAGNDYLDGGDDDDVYLFGFDSGHDTVFDSGSSAGDTVRFADGVSPEDVSLCRFQDHLIVSLGEGQDSLSLGRWFTDSTKVERFEFADGTVWTDAMVSGMLTPAPDGNDSPDPNVEVNGSGEVTINDGFSIHKYNLPEEFKFPSDLGTPGGNWTTGGVVSDASSSLAGLLVFWQYWQNRQAELNAPPTSTSLTLQGTGYGDHLHGGDGDDRLYGEDGNDYLAGDDGHDSLSGGAGQDMLFGGDGYDFLDGGDGDDWLEGNSGGDSLRDRSGKNVMDGGSGDDYLQGGTGEDTMYGGAGNDHLNDDYDSPDAMYGGTGDDDLSGGYGNDVLDGGEGNDTLSGSRGDDILKGGPGTDKLFGGDGNDIFLFGKGDGCDFLGGHGYWSDHVGEGDVLRFGEGITATDIVVTSQYIDRSDGPNYLDSSRDLVLTLRDTGESVHICSWFNEIDAREMLIEFSDGTTLDQTQFAGLPLTSENPDQDDRRRAFGALLGGELDDVIEGHAGNDELYGCRGEDILDGGSGDDYLYGGLDNDILIGGSGNDLYELGKSEYNLYYIFFMFPEGEIDNGIDVLIDLVGSNTVLLPSLSPDSLSLFAMNYNDGNYSIGQDGRIVADPSGKDLLIEYGYGSLIIVDGLESLENTYVFGEQATYSQQFPPKFYVADIIQQLQNGFRKLTKGLPFVTT